MSRLLYLDTSAAMKRAFLEEGSAELRDQITEVIAAGDRFVTSDLTLVEVARGARRRIDEETPLALQRATDAALGDTATAPIDDRVVTSARLIGPAVLRSLDAIHLATAILVKAAELWTYDDRLAQAAREMGILARMPGRDCMDP